MLCAVARIGSRKLGCHLSVYRVLWSIKKRMSVRPGDPRDRNTVNQVVIENPISNSPFSEPTGHFRFINEGTNNENVDGRRPGSYFTEVLKKYGDARIEKAHP